MVVVAEHAALRRARGSPGVDERAEVGRPDRHLQLRIVGAEQRVPLVNPRRGTCADRISRARFLAVVDHDHVLEVGQLVEDGVDAVGQRALHEHDARSRVAELMPEILALVCGVDRNADGAAPHRAPPREERLGRVLDEHRDAVALTDAEVAQRVRQPVRRRVHRRCGQLTAAHVEIGAVGIVVQAPIEERRDRVLFAADPRVFRHAGESILSAWRGIRRSSSFTGAARPPASGIGSSRTSTHPRSQSTCLVGRASPPTP